MLSHGWLGKQQVEVDPDSAGFRTLDGRSIPSVPEVIAAMQPTSKGLPRQKLLRQALALYARSRWAPNPRPQWQPDHPAFEPIRSQVAKIEALPLWDDVGRVVAAPLLAVNRNQTVAMTIDLLAEKADDGSLLAVLFHTEDGLPSSSIATEVGAAIQMAGDRLNQLVSGCAVKITADEVKMMDVNTDDATVMWADAWDGYCYLKKHDMLTAATAES